MQELQLFRPSLLFVIRANSCSLYKLQQNQHCALELNHLSHAHLMQSLQPLRQLCEHCCVCPNCQVYSCCPVPQRMQHNVRLTRFKQP